ncbi:MAG: hypothetical protein P8080_09635 [Gammaproteobacteria bacterium]
MATKQEVQAELEKKLDAGESQLDKLKAKLAEAGDEASDEMKDAVAAAERGIEKGRIKLEELAEMSDEKFEQVWATAKDDWRAAMDDIEAGWSKLSAKVKSFFA